MVTAVSQLHGHLCCLVLLLLRMQATVFLEVWTTAAGGLLYCTPRVCSHCYTL
jgi:hypothetical protein